MNSEAVVKPQSSLGIRGYFEVLSDVVRSPLRFFESVADEKGSKRAGTFLFISAIFYSSVSMTYFYDRSFLFGTIILANAMLMPFLTAGITYALDGLFVRNGMQFSKFYIVYAYATGAMMLISWLPSLGWVFEPIRAALVCVGLVKVCGYRWIQAVIMVVATAIVLVTLFWLLAPLLVQLKNLLA